MLFTRHRSTVEPMMVANDRKATLLAIHTSAVNQAVNRQEVNVVLDDRPPLINSEKDLTRKQRTPLAQLRSGHCRLLSSYKSRINKDTNLKVCADCGRTPHDLRHLLIPGSSNNSDAVGFIEQTSGRYLETAISRCEDLAEMNQTERRTTTNTHEEGIL